MKKLTLVVLALAAIVGSAAFASTRICGRIAGGVIAASRRGSAVRGASALRTRQVGDAEGRPVRAPVRPRLVHQWADREPRQLQDTGYADVANDNYVVEEGHRLLTYILPANAHITVLTREGQPDAAGFASTAVTPAQLAELLAGKEPVKLFEGLSTGFWMQVHVDTVCSLRQQFRP